jgi:IS1 family transposase
MIDRLLLEKIPLAGIVRVMEISARWLQTYVNQVYKTVSRRLNVSAKAKKKLTVQMDELGSFVDHKGNRQWVWLAMDAETREIIGCAIGDRSKETAKALWESIPGVYRPCAVIYTDGLESYGAVLPRKRHRVVGKESGKTSYIERLNNTLRQRISRLVRKTLSFSKKQVNHEGAIWNFIHHYNACLKLEGSMV